MAIEVRVPMLPESVTEATLLNWHKKAGETVKREENLVDLETEKVVLEIPAPRDGILKEILRQDGDTVNADDLLAVIDPTPLTDSAPAPESPPQKGNGESKPQGQDPSMSPTVRRLVSEHELDPSRIPATGKHGRITKSDVLNYVQGQGSATPPDQDPGPPATPVTPVTPKTPGIQQGPRGERRQTMSRLRATIASRLVQAQRDAAMLTTFNEINLQAVIDLRTRYREQFEQRHGVRLGFMSFFVKACIEGLRQFPVINASVDGNDIVYHDFYDIGIAVSSPRGLVVPVLRDPDQKDFGQIENEIAGYVDKARAGKLSMDDLRGGTFTITNGGVFGSLLSTPILNPPQSGILGMHKIEPRPVVEDGKILARPMMYVALSYDHRIVDGREAVQYLVLVKQALEDPARLLLNI